MQRKKGISLIVLVITIIVMIILAAAIILSLNNAGIIGNANKAVEMTNEKTIQTAADLKYAEYLLKNDIIGSSSVGEWIKAELIKDGVIPTGQENDYIVTDEGEVINIKLLDSTIQSAARAIYEKMVADGTVSTMLNQGEYIKQQLINDGTVTSTQASMYRFKNNGDVIRLQTKAEYEAMYAEELAMLDESYYTITDGVFKLTSTGKTEATTGSLTKLAIPYGVTTIYWAAAMDCTALEKVVMPDTVASIERVAFADCENLATVVFSKNITDIDYAFRNTKWLNDKKEEVKNTNGLVIEEGILIDGKYATGNVIIPNTVEILDAFAFETNQNITSVFVPNTVVKIKDQVFLSATNLVSIEFEGQIPEIGYGAFGATNLPETVKQLLLEKNADAFSEDL